LRDDIASPSRSRTVLEPITLTLHHPTLLKILFAEHRDIRAALGEKLADHGGDATEEMRSEAIFQPCGRRPLRNNPRGKAVRVHGLDVRVPDHVNGFGGEFLQIGLPRARV
jgi:hypothetical protein